MRMRLVAIACVAVLFGCSAIRSDQPQKLDTRPKIKMVAAGLIGDCPKEADECEIFLTIVDNPNTDPQEGGAGTCEVAVPVSEIHLHSTRNHKQRVRWTILNKDAFGFTQLGVAIDPNVDNSGHAGAFEDGHFTDSSKDDQYQWQSSGNQSDHPGGDPNKHNGYIAYVYRKSGNLTCGTKDPLIANL